MDYRKLAQGAIGAYYSQPPRYSQLTGQPYRHADGTRTMTQTQKRRRVGNKKSFKQLMLNNSSAKHFGDTGNVAILHDNIYTFNITAQVTQGDANTNRDGDHINLEALKIRGFYSSAVTAGAYSFRMLVGYSGEEYLAPNFTTGVGGLGAGEIFLPGAPTNHTSLVNPKAFTTLLDFNVDINSQIAATADISSILKTILLKQGFNYQSTASTFGKVKNLYVVLIGNVVGGTVAVTPVGECIIGTDLIFK